MKNTFALITLLSLFSFNLLAKVENESELSLLKSGGNTEFATYNLKTNFKLIYSGFDIEAGGHYTYGTSGNLIISRNWDFALKETKKFSSSKFALYLGQQIEGDNFAGIDSRFNVDLGLKYQFLKDEKNNIKSEVGFRSTNEKQVGGTNETFSKARVYLEGERKHSKEISFKIWMEYLPNFTKSEDWIYTTEPSLNVSLSNTFSFKFGYKYIYQNLPPAGKGKIDYLTSTTLIAKF